MIMENAKLNEVARIDRASLSPDKIQSGTSYLGLENIQSGGQIIRAETVESGELKSSKFSFTSEHLLYGKLRPYLAKIAAPDFDGICSTDIIPILPGPKIDRKYLLYFLRQDSMVAFANSRSSGANLPRLSPKELASFNIPLPHLNEQKRIASILNAADELRAQRRKSIAQLDALLQSIFSEMFGDPVVNPKDWELATIGEHIKVLGGFAFKSSDFTQQGVPIIRISNLLGDSVSLDKCARIPKSFLGKGDRFRLQPGDTLIAMSGATTGKLGFVPDDLYEEWYLNQRVGAFRIPNHSRVRRQYLRALLRSSFYQRHVWNLAGGAAQPNISGKQLESARIPVPPLDLQHNFEAIVESIEQQKVHMQSHLTELDALFTSLQHRAFTGEL